MDRQTEDRSRRDHVGGKAISRLCLAMGRSLAQKVGMDQARYDRTWKRKILALIPICWLVFHVTTLSIAESIQRLMVG
jgi:hypothetical protein